MYVALGFCAAGLLALAVLSAVWRRAVRLTRQAVEATSPMRHADVRAEIGALKARNALEQRRLETGLERLQNELVANRVARDRAEAAASDLRKEFVARDQALSEAHAREEDLRRDLKEHEEALARARARQRDLERSLKRLSAAPDTGAAPVAQAGAEAPGMAETAPEDGSAGLQRTSDLARIASLESELTALRRALKVAQAGAGGDAGDSERPADRQARRARDDRLFDTESKLIAAQAEITRLSVLLEDARAAAPDPDGGLAPVDAERLARLDAETDRLEAENARLRADLHSNDAFASLRRELTDLADSVSARLDARPSAETPKAEDVPEASSAPSPPPPSSVQPASQATPPPAGVSARSEEERSLSSVAQSLSARIGAARKRLKTDKPVAADPEDTASAAPDASRRKTGQRDGDRSKRKAGG